MLFLQLRSSFNEIFFGATKIFEYRGCEKNDVYRTPPAITSDRDSCDASCPELFKVGLN